MPRQRKLKKLIRASMQPGENYTAARARILAAGAPPTRRTGGGMYPFERFTEDAKQVLTAAQAEATSAQHSYIGTEHLLLALARTPGPAQDALSALGVEQPAVREAIARVTSSGERVRIPSIIPTSRVKRVIELAFEVARAQKEGRVDSGALLLGLAIEGEGIAARVLADLGGSLAAIADQLGVDAAALPVERAQPDRPPVQLATHSRVLAHELDPPYRLYEGTIVQVTSACIQVAFGEGRDQEVGIVPADRLHTIPPRVDRCPYCEFKPG